MIMKELSRIVTFAALMVMAALAPCASGRAAPADAEQALIAVLESTKSAAEKAAACRGLKPIATAKSVPALASLLADKDLSHWARLVLESMPCPEPVVSSSDSFGQMGVGVGGDVHAADATFGVDFDAVDERLEQLLGLRQR
jgi:hypothetical protein